MVINNIQASAKGMVIIAEDDLSIRKCLVKYLTVVGYDVTGVGSALEIYQHIAVNSYQVAILDIGLPDQSGIALCEYLRNNTDMRIIMLTGRSTIEEKLAGYNSGADIYLVKPVDFRELSASISNLLRRRDIALQTPQQQQGESEDKLLSAKNKRLWKLDRAEWSLYNPDGKMIKLTSKEFEFMNCFISNSHKNITRKEIMSILDYEHNEYGKRALESLVHRLRQKIDINGTSPIKTVFGVGFNFAEELLIE
ncbi:MAG: response regulator transcription factor [Chlorobium sp.]|nr:MAG: response regulator transcription factor [Chlorobium sp.]